MPFNKLFDIPSFPNITLSLFQALFFTGRMWYDGWLMSQRLGKSRIASMKVSLSKGSTFCPLVASSLNKQNDHRYLQNIQLANWKTRQPSKMETFAKIFDVLKPVTIFAKSCILDVWLSSEYASDSNDNNIIMSMSHIVKHVLCKSSH